MPTSNRHDPTRVIRAPRGPPADGQELADRGRPADADEQPRPRGGRAAGGPGGLRRHRPGGPRLAVLRHDRRSAAAARRRPDAAGSVGQAGGRLSDAPRRPARAAGQLEPRAALGHLGAFQRTRPPRADDVRPDDRRLVDLHRLARHRAGHLRDVRRGRQRNTSAATSAAAGFSPAAWAAWAGRSRWPPPWPGPRCWPSNATRRGSSGGCKPAISTAKPSRSTKPSARIEQACREGRAVSVGLLGNCAEVLPEIVRRGVTPDLLTDQTSAHDPLNGYLPAGWTLEQARRMRSERSGGGGRGRPAVDRRPRSGDARIARPRRAHLRLRQQHPAGGQGRGRGRTPSISPASCRPTSARCSAKASARFAGWPSRAIRRTSTGPTRRSRS